MLDDAVFRNTVTCMRKPFILILLAHALFLLNACAGGARTASTPTTEPALYPDIVSPYKLKEPGPGGGIVFYASRKPFPRGPDLSSLCNFLEVAPFAVEVKRPWAQEGNVATDVPGAERSAIGTGWANTLAIIEQGNTDPMLSAAAYAEAYEQNGYTDWYLPSRDEVHELTITREVIGGFTMETYWTSTERDGARVWYQNFLSGFQFLDDKSVEYIVRPVRAF